MQKKIDISCSIRNLPRKSVRGWTSTIKQPIIPIRSDNNTTLERNDKNNCIIFDSVLNLIQELALELALGLLETAIAAILDRQQRP